MAYKISMGKLTGLAKKSLIFIHDQPSGLFFVFFIRMVGLHLIREMNSPYSLFERGDRSKFPQFYSGPWNATHQDRQWVPAEEILLRMQVDEGAGKEEAS